MNFERHPDAEPSLDGYDGLIVLGGPMNVDEVGDYPNLETEVHLIRQAIDKEMPTLGVCLGSQLLAKALGAKVTKNPEKEIGWYDVSPTSEGEGDPLLSNFTKTEKIFQWHGDTFDLPKGAELLASSPLCKHQAFKYGDRVYGFQFHLEVDKPMIERWLRVPENKREIEDLDGKINPEQIKAETPEYISRLNDLSNSVFGNFLELFGYNKKRHTLPSR